MRDECDLGEHYGFDRMTDAYVALWWVPLDHRPTIAEAVERMEHLKRHGPSPVAFTFLESYPTPGAAAAASIDS